MTERATPTVYGLKGVRRAVGLTQKQLAARLGVSQSQVSRIERAWPDVHLSTAQQYVRGCGAHLRVEIVCGEVITRIDPLPLCGWRGMASASGSGERDEET